MADRRPPRQRGHADEKTTGAPRKEARNAPVSANKAIPPSRISRAADVADDPIPDSQADTRNRRRDAVANPAETAARAREASAARRDDDEVREDPRDEHGDPRDEDENPRDEDEEADDDAAVRDPQVDAETEAHRHRLRRNYDIPISLGAASIHDAPFTPVGVGEDPAREPRLLGDEPDVERTSDPTRATPFLAEDDPDVADNPRETIAAREQADSPEHGSDSPGHQQDQ